jgi:hypothetical protein
MGKLADRHGVMRPVLIGAAGLGTGYIGAGLSGGIVWGFALAHGVLLGLLGSLGDLRAAGRRHLAVVRAPARHRGGGLRQRQLPGRRHLAADRAALRRAGGLAADLHRAGRAVCADAAAAGAAAAPAAAGRAAPPPAARGGQCRRTGPSASLNQAQVLLCVAGVACCVAMAMPQVHIVAYCGDLGYGAGARRRDAER